jgi:hypothetical protein
VCCARIKLSLVGTQYFDNSIQIGFDGCKLAPCPFISKSLLCMLKTLLLPNACFREGYKIEAHFWSREAPHHTKEL